MKGRIVNKAALIASAGFLASTAFVSPASATEGYFQPGYGAIQKSLAGSGTANPEDAMTLAVNPAGLTSVGQEFEANLTWFSPSRKYEASGTLLVAPGTVKSGWEDFILPAAAYSQPIDSSSSWGIAMYGNGGMNTNYKDTTPRVICTLAGGKPGVYCGGKTGVNLSQIFLSAGYSWRSGDWQFGVAPIFALQMFNANGLSLFGNFGLSSAPANLTNRGIDYSYGGGARVGAIWNVAPHFRLALAGTTPMWMSKLSKYKGLFAGGGGFDIPASVSVGAAWDAAPDWTLMLDYKHIFYSTIDSVGDSTALTSLLGSKKGPGFGWTDVDAVSVGAEWRVTPDWTLRAGYAHNTNPIGSNDVTLNILAPGVVTDHIAAGVTHKMGHSSIDLAFIYVPRHSVSGPEVTPFGATPGSDIRLSMQQTDLTIGYRYDF